MERHQIIDAMTSLKLYGMRANFDEIADPGGLPPVSRTPSLGV